MGRFPLLFAFAFALTGTQATLSAQTTSDWVFEQQAGGALKNVVRVEPAGAPSGAGFIIGRRGDQLWVATAAHVLFSDAEDADGFPVPRDSIAVRMHDGRTWPAADSPQRAFGEDLAFVPIRVPRAEEGLQTWRDLVIEDDPEPGARARIAATSSSIQYDEWDGEIARDGEEISVTGLSRAGEGQSGAPIFAGRGFVGMYLQSAGRRVLPISAIRTAARDANLPWTLTAYPARPIAVRVCVAASGAPPGTVRINNIVGGVARPDEAGCASTLSGQVTIFVDGASPGYQCAPSPVILTRESEQRISVSCGPTVAGWWGAGGFGSVTFIAAGERRWTFSGLDQAPFGPVSGDATLVETQLFLRGRNGMSQPILATLNAEPARLTGTLLVNGQSYPIGLSR